MRLIIQIIHLFIFVLIFPPLLIAGSEPSYIYGVTIYLKNNKKLDGYIQTCFDIDACIKNESVNEKEQPIINKVAPPHPILIKHDISSEGKGTKNNKLDPAKLLKCEYGAKFISKVLEVHYGGYIKKEYHNIPKLLAPKSSIKNININEIKSIEGVCRKWNGNTIYEIIPDRMAKMICNQKMIASYWYVHDYGELIFLSYNPKYTRKELIKLRDKLWKMSDEKLENEGLVRFGGSWD